MNITLTGATGFIGRHLTRALLDRGDNVTILTRTARPGAEPHYLPWDTQSAPPPEAMEADVIIHLAGETVAQRWNSEVKQRIRSSRIDSTRALVDGILKSRHKPLVLISASAIGIYGHRGDELLTEASAPGSGFLEDVSAAWERESARASEAGVRVVNPRIGIVLGPDGGALAQMLTPFKIGIGGKLASGTQWMSWIHVDDAIGLILLALDRGELQGPMNTTAPHPVTNADFTRELASVLRRPAIFPVPEIALRILYGEMAHVLTSSQRVVPEAALRCGYRFRFETLRPALESILRAR
jgi:uncharacterized protein